MKKILLSTTALAVMLMASIESKAQWGLNGNAGTNPATNFLGTTDNKAFKIRTNNVVRVSVTGAGKVGIGTGNPLSKLDVLGASGVNDTTPVINSVVKYAGSKDVTAISGTAATTDTTGIGVHGEGNLAGVEGVSNNFGVFGAGFTGLFGSSGTAGVVGEPTGVWGENSGGATGNGVFGFSSGATQNIAVWGIATDTSTATSPVDFAGYFQGNVLAWKYYTPSDARIKNNIQPLTGALAKIAKLQTATYTFKQAEFPKLYLPAGNQIGFLADNMKAVFPDLVKEVSLPGKVNPKTHQVITEGADINVVNYMGMVPVLTAAIQEQQILIEKKDVQLAELSARLAALESRLSAVEAGNTSVSTERTAKDASSSAKLEQNSPNPFSQSTVIRYFVPENAGSAQIIITASNGNVLKNYSVKGKANGEITVNANELTAGLYTYSLLIDGKIVDTKSLVLTK